MHLALANPRGDYAPWDKHDRRKATFFLHTSQSSKCPVRAPMSAIRKACKTMVHQGPPFNDLMRPSHHFFYASSVVLRFVSHLHARHIACRTAPAHMSRNHFCNLQKLLEPIRKPKVIYTVNSLEFGKACEEWTWNHCTSTPHRSETIGLLKEQCAELRREHLRYCCNQVWMKNGGRIPWNVAAICVDSTPHTSLFLLYTTRVSQCVSHTHLAQERVCTRHSILMPSMLSVWASLFLAFVISVCLSYPLLFSAHFYLHFVLNLFVHVDNAKAINHWHSANWGVWPLGRIHPSQRLWVQAPWRLPLLGDCWNHLPGGIPRQRNGALVLAWCGYRRRDHQESTLFTTVHSGATRISGPKTCLSLLWRKLVASSVIFHTLKNAETRAWT